MNLGQVPACLLIHMGSLGGGSNIDHNYLPWFLDLDSSKVALRHRGSTF